MRVLSVVVLLTIVVPANAAEEDPLQTQSRALVQAFAAQLQQALKSAIADGGPTAAISVCRDEAPKIASEVSRQHGANVGRTSLRTRNPLNLPEPWQRQVLEDFAANHTPGAAPQEYFDRGEGRVRYMSSIELKGLCATCHGEVLAEEVSQRLAADYPHDQAIGYRVGEIRGAFTIVWPEDKSGSSDPMR